MVVLPQMLTGRSFQTKLDFDGDAVWAPLEAVARIARQSPELSSFHEGEFMYMGAVHNERKGLTIHLYKHRDTRRYLNLDDAGHAYAYRYREDDPHDGLSGGRYQRYRTLVDALEAADLWLFEEEPHFFRSFPPDQWPEEDPCATSSD
ncbi:MAG: hypothetical protein QOC92_1110 [Acidimicrobiaceae bacterium]|jgi:hypothetical protein